MSGKQVGYIRVSTHDQNTERQLQGIHLDKVYEDKISGKDTQRPALQACLEFLREDDTLMVHSMDRLARNVVDLITLVNASVMRGAERRPVAVRNVMGASEWRAADATFTLPATLNDASEEGNRTRQRLGTIIAQSPRGRQFATELPGVDLGVTYEGSPICIVDETPPPLVLDDTYQPSARPGARAPHVALADGSSLLDHFSSGWTLLRCGGEPHEAEALFAEAARRHLPIILLDGTIQEVQALYERHWVLIRPDGHIAWRTDTLPDHSATILDTVCGYAPPQVGA